MVAGHLCSEPGPVWGLLEGRHRGLCREGGPVGPRGLPGSLEVTAEVVRLVRRQAEDRPLGSDVYGTERAGGSRYSRGAVVRGAGRPPGDLGERQWS